MKKMDLKILDEAIDFLFDVEGCVLTPYKDAGGVWTVGVGFTFYKGKKVTQTYPQNLTCDDCKEELLSIVSGIISDINSLVKTELSDNQVVALCSFIFNVGISAFEQSTMLKMINENELDQASKQFLLWNHVNGAVCTGLTNRRRKEQALFNGETTI